MSRESTETIRTLRQDRVKAAEQALQDAAARYADAAEYLAHCVRDLAALDAPPGAEYDFRDLDNPPERDAELRGVLARSPEFGNPDRYATCDCDMGDVHSSHCDR